MTNVKSLEGAVYLARSGKSRDLTRAAVRLDGCPEGGWPETQQAWRDIESWLPLESERSYDVATFVDALYAIDGAGRYRAKIWLEREEAKRARLAKAQKAARAVPALELEASPLPNPYTGELQCRTVSVYLDDEGYICTRGGDWDEVSARVPVEWTQRAKAVRAEIVAARTEAS